MAVIVTLIQNRTSPEVPVTTDYGSRNADKEGVLLQLSPDLVQQAWGQAWGRELYPQGLGMNILVIYIRMQMWKC